MLNAFRQHPHLFIWTLLRILSVTHRISSQAIRQQRRSKSCVPGSRRGAVRHFIGTVNETVSFRFKPRGAQNCTKTFGTPQILRVERTETLGPEGAVFTSFWEQVSLFHG